MCNSPIPILAPSNTPHFLFTYNAGQLGGLYLSMSSNYKERMEEVEQQLGITDSAGAVQTTRHEVLGELKGKIVERIEYVKLDPDVFGDVLCIFFMDGSVLELEAGVDDLFGVMRWTVS